MQFLVNVDDESINADIIHDAIRYRLPGSEIHVQPVTQPEEEESPIWKEGEREKFLQRITRSNSERLLKQSEKIHPIIMDLLNQNKANTLNVYVLTKEVPFDEQPNFASDVVQLNSRTLMKKIKSVKK